MRPLAYMLGLLSSAALAACHVGPRIGELAAPREPGGARVLIAVDRDARRGARHEGELVAVRDDGVIVALSPAGNANVHLTFAPWAAFYRLTATDLPGFRTTPENGKAPPRELEIERLRLVSRYPQGLSPELTANLLAAYDQASLDSLPAEAH